MKSKLRLSIALLGLAAALPCQSAEIAIDDFSPTPDGSTTTFSQGTDVKTENGGVNVLAGTTDMAYVITTFTFGTGSDAHLQAGWSTAAIPTSTNRLAIRVEDTGQVTWQGSGDTSRTSFDFAQDMAGETVTLLMKFDYDVNRNTANADDTLANTWVNPTNSSVEGADLGRAAGDLSTIWNSSGFVGFAQLVYNESTPNIAGAESSITDTTILTGADATWPRALEWALGGPTSPGTVSAFISTVSASPILVANDNTTTSTITVTLTDSAGDPVAGKEVSLASDGDANITTGDNISDVNGEVTFAVKSGTESVQEFTATNVTDSNLVLYQTATVTFEPVGTIDPDTSTVVASLPDVPADDSTTSTITVTLRNSLGDPVSGKNVSLSSDGDATIDPAGTDTTDVNGEATFTVRSGTQGTQIFTATDVTGTPPPASIPVTQTVQVVFTEVSPTPAILFHEPFDFADGSDLNGQGGWTAGTNTSGAFVEVHDGAGLEPWDGAFTGVTQSGNYAGRSFTPNTLADWVYGGHALDPSVTATFTDGAVTWLSFIQYGNNAQVAIGADVLQQRGNVAAGQNIGMGGLFNNSAVRAHYWDDEDSNGSFEDHPSLTTIGSSNPHFVIARIVWSDSGVDSITCARFTSGSTISEAEFNAASQSTISADLDQSVFDTVSFAGSQYYIDEIRIATAFDEAVNGTGGGASPFETWADLGSLGPVTFDGDTNGDGVRDGLAFLLGVVNPDDSALGLLPTTSEIGGDLVMSFTCLATADRGTATLNLEYDGDLAGTWLSVPVPGAVGAPNPIVETTATGSVSFVATDGGTNTNGDALIDIVATISDATESASGKLFGRLKGND